MKAPCSFGLRFSLGSFIFGNSRLVVAAVVVVVVVRCVVSGNFAAMVPCSLAVLGKLRAWGLDLSIESIARFTFRGRIQRPATTPEHCSGVLKFF